MDFPTFLKPAANDLNQSPASGSDAQQQSQWQAWDAGGEDDSWEDVTDVAVPPEATTANPLPAAPTLTPAISTSTTVPAAAAPTTPAVPVAAADDQVAGLKAQLKAALDRASAAERKNIALSRTRQTAVNSADLDKKLQAALQEGEKLSIRIAEKEQTARAFKNTLKVRESELDDAMAGSSALSAKLEAVNARLKQLETNERAALDSRDAAERRLREVEAESRGSKTSSVAVDTLRAQLEKERKQHQAMLETQAMRLTAERDAAVHEHDTRFQAREDEVEKSMHEMRQHLSQVDAHAQWREEQLRRENDELRARAQHLEARNEELAEALPGATRPLIRQIEALQAAAGERESAKDAAERASIRRVRVAEKAASEARQREQVAEDKVSEVLAKVAGLEERLRIAQKEVRQGLEDIEKVRRECADREDQAATKVKDGEERMKRAERQAEEAREEARDVRKMMVEGMEGAEEREKDLRRMVADGEAKVAMALEREREMRTKMNSMSARNQDNEEVGSFGSRNASSSNVDALSKLSSHMIHDHNEEDGVYDRERLSTSLKLRRGEVEKLQAQLESKEKATRALAEEVVSLTTRLEAVEMSKEGHEREAEAMKLEELSMRHNTLLELLGEREERIGELEADLADVQSMYKDQVTELLLRIERLNS